MLLGTCLGYARRWPRMQPQFWRYVDAELTIYESDGATFASEFSERRNSVIET
jgi:hypothetical protein